MADLLKELFFNIETLGAVVIGLVAIVAIIIYAITHKTKPLEIKPVELESGEVNDLEWVLSSDERREIGKKIVIKLLFASVPVLFGVLFLRIIDMEISSIKYYVLLYLVIIIPIFLLFYLYTYIHKPKECRYKFMSQGAFVSRGTEQKEFSWSDFVYFYINPLAIQSETKKEGEKSGYFEQVRNIRGEIYYLKLKPTGIFSKMNIIERILVIYTKPDNFQKVYAFLLTKLQQQPAENVGFQRYYFK